MSKKIALTGIKPTGTPHIGNYFGAIKPALELANEYDARYFIADYHALNQVKNSTELNSHVYEVAATWLACGLDPKKAIIYRQSDIPEIYELTQILNAFTPKGLMNRAHAYKAKTSENIKKNKNIDFGINMGLYTYPILMAADILMFNTNIVPVGKDQKQHVEMAADIAQALNSNYNTDALVIPNPIIRDDTKTITGLDGRKMSKSYNNTIPLFLPPKKLRKLLMKIVTNSQGIEESKNPDECNVFSIYKLFANQEQENKLRERYIAGGMGWGHAKQELFELMDSFLSPMREIYNNLLNDKTYIDEILNDGAEKAREISSKTISRLRKVVGISR